MKEAESNEKEEQKNNKKNEKVDNIIQKAKKQGKITFLFQHIFWQY